MKRFEVRNADIEARLKDIGQAVQESLPDGWGFTLFIYSYGEGGSMFYLSSAKREDMLLALQEFMERNQPPGAEGRTPHE